MAISNSTDIEKKLWAAADELRANSKLKASEYSVSVLGLIFLRYADAKFARAEVALQGERVSKLELIVCYPEQQRRASFPLKRENFKQKIKIYYRFPHQNDTLRSVVLHRI